MAKTPIWLWPNLLSLDAPLVAVVWQECFARDLGVRLSFAARCALASAVWFIYLFDRLLDTRHAPTTARHVFCTLHKRLCGTLTCLSAVTLAFSVWQLSAPVVRGGLTVGALVALYLFFVHFAGRNRLRKEAAVGVLFALGCGLAPYERAADAHAILFPALMFGVLCWLNAAAIEAWESGSLDRVSQWFVDRMQVVCCGVVAISLMAGLHGSYGALAVTAIGYCVVMASRSQLSADALRVAIDVPLLAPLLWR